MRHSCLKFFSTHTVRAFHLKANDIAQKLFWSQILLILTVQAITKSGPKATHESLIPRSWDVLGQSDNRKGSSGVVKGVSWRNLVPKFPQNLYYWILTLNHSVLAVWVWSLISWLTTVLYQFCFQKIYMLCATCCSDWLFCVLKALLKSLE